MTPTLALVPPHTDHPLIEQINHEHHQAIQAWRTTAHHACRCGQLLLQAKLELEHGTWGTWLAENFDGSERTAQRYMQLAQHAIDHPEILDELPALSLHDAVDRIAEPRGPRDLAAPSVFHLTVDQLLQLVRSFGGNANEDKVQRWIERLTEPKVITCPHCQQPVLQAVIKGQTVLAEKDAWIEQVLCTKCLQTRRAHPDSYVNCAHCSDTGIIGTKNRPPGRMLAVDVAWSDDDQIHLRVIGPNTDRRRGEALHSLHTCHAAEVAA